MNHEDTLFAVGTIAAVFVVLVWIAAGVMTRLPAAPAAPALSPLAAQLVEMMQNERDWIRRTDLYREAFWQHTPSKMVFYYSEMNGIRTFEIFIPYVHVFDVHEEKILIKEFEAMIARKLARIAKNEELLSHV